MISQPAHSAPQETAGQFCKFYDHAKELAGQVVTLKGEYNWSIHFKTIVPDGCTDDASIFVRFDLNTENTVAEFLRRAYPNVNFGGGAVWGTFTGIVFLPKNDLPSIFVTDVQIDESRRMKLSNP